MKSFLQFLGLVLLAIVAVKLLPATLALGFAAGGLLVVLGTLGVSLLAVTVLASLVMLAVLAPLWVPVALVIGLVVLLRRATQPVRAIERSGGS